MAEPILVVDVSHHQGRDVDKVDGLPLSHWKALAKCGIKAAIIKVSQGTAHIDEDAAIHVERARAAAGSPTAHHAPIRRPT